MTIPDVATFTPAPPNTFLAFMRTYYERCRAQSPQIRGIAAKWAFADLVPGLSDFDTRFIVDDSTTVQDWGAMSIAVGRVHGELCREFPEWARNLEHLPGINLTVSEITNPRLFYPEFAQWTFYEGDSATLATIEKYLAERTWSARDELHHLKKFATYFGPYQRGIDPPVNVEPWEGKYPLHSRFMHYFAPPVQSAVSLALRRNVRGKLEALQLARELFNRPATIDKALAAVAAHYEWPDAYHDPALANLETELETYLQQVWQALSSKVTLVKPDRADNPAAVRAKVAAAPSDPLNAFYESAKFGRLLKGRLMFFSQRIPHFDSRWLIQIELGRIVPSFYTKPLTIFGRVYYGQELTAPRVLQRLRGNLLSPEQCDALNHFAHVAAEPIVVGREREQAARVADCFDVVPVAMHLLGQELLARAGHG